MYVLIYDLMSHIIPVATVSILIVQLLAVLIIELLLNCMFWLSK